MIVDVLIGDCVDECEVAGVECVADDLATCAMGLDGCLVLDTQPCPDGCAAGACTGAPADLAISIVSAVWFQTELQVTYVVANVGLGPAPEFRVDLWPDRAGGFDGPPSVGDIGPLGDIKPGLAAGDDAQYTDSIPMAPNGRHVAFAVIDGDGAIAESDENNNVSLGFGWTNTGGEIHTSFGAPSAPLAIPDDGTPLDTAIEVVTDAVAGTSWVSINLTHPDVSEIELQLISPSGAGRVLAALVPAGADFGGTTFRDGAGVALQDEIPPFVGEYEALSAWDQDPGVSGTWTLRVTDLMPGNEGRINDWSVTVLE